MNAWYWIINKWWDLAFWLGITEQHRHYSKTYGFAVDGNETKPKRDDMRLARVAMVLGIILSITAIVIIVGQAITDHKGGQAVATTTSSPFALPFVTPSPTTSAPATTDDRDPRFVQKDVGLGDLHRVIGKGLNGKNAKQFTASVLKVSGHSAQALAIYASGSHLWDDPNNTETLLTPDGTYLSQRGIMLWASLQGALTAKGTKKKMGQAPADWFNTGYSGGKFGRAGIAGIGGNRTALIIYFKDGSKIVILRRCGNLAFPGKGGLPVVPTDNPKPKIASQDPAAQGNAPVGGGQNQDPGPGEYTKKPKKPPHTPRPNPTTPAPSPSPTPGATSTPTPDPQPTPKPELPTPAATETATPPGM